MEIGNGTFLNGDCLELMKDLPDASVDMVLCDLPYGTTACSWDSVIPFEPLWEQYWRICRPNAAIVLTASQPFTTALIASQMGKFKYCWVWNKKRPSNPMLAKVQPMKVHEDVCVFGWGKTRYEPQGLIETDGKPRGGTNPSRTELGFGKSIKKPYVQTKTNYPKSILEVGTDNSRNIHPTQKPVALFEYLIRTYTNEGEVVLDNTAGSGTTAIAAEQSGRKWICMERDPDYYAAALGRVWDHVNAA